MYKSKNTLTNLGINLAGIIVLYIILQTLLTTGVFNGYIEGVMVLIGINIVAASSLNFASGILGQLALGHAGFMAVGAYSAAIFVKNYGKAMIKGGTSEVVVLILCLVIAGVMAALAGVIIGVPALRLRGDYLGIVTLGFGEIIRIAIYNLEITQKAKPVTGIPHLVEFSQIFVIVVTVIVVFVLLIHSRHGRAILSIREDEIASEAAGIPTIKYKVFGFATSAFFAGVAGSTLAFHSQIIDPKKFTFMFSVEMFIIVVFGGMGSLTGTVVAAIILGIFNEVLRDLDQWRLVLYALLLVGMMILRPEGILGRRELSLPALVKKAIGASINKKTTI